MFRCNILYAPALMNSNRFSPLHIRSYLCSPFYNKRTGQKNAVGICSVYAMFHIRSPHLVTEVIFVYTAATQIFCANYK